MTVIASLLTRECSAPVFLGRVGGRALVLFLLLLGTAFVPLQAQQWRLSVTNKNFNHMFMLNASVGWAVGDGGTIARTVDGGASWRFQISGTTTNLKGVWASSHGDVWAVGESGLILRWNGSTWTNYDSGTNQTFNCVFGWSANEVWAGTSNDGIKKWNGTAWGPHSSSEATSIWGAAPNNAWAAGVTTLKRWNGTSWTNYPTGVSCKSVHGTDANTIWAVGPSGYIYRWGGTSWVRQTSGTTSDFYAVWVADANNVWAVGEAGLMYKWTGTGWQAQASGVTSNLNTVTGLGTANVFCAGANGVVRNWDGTSWTTQTSPSGDTFTKISMVSPTAGYAVTSSSNLWRWDGYRWKVITALPSVPSGLWAADANTAYVSLSSGQVQKWNGTGLTGYGTSRTYESISGVDANNVWIGHDGYSTYKWDGTSVVDVGGAGITVSSADQVYARDINNIWAVGASGHVQKWNGDAWQVQSSGVTTELRGVFGLDADRAWAVGDSGVIRRWNGTAWVSEVSGTTGTLMSVWASDASNVWAVGASGRILKWNGVAWEGQTSGITGTIYSISGTSPNNLWVASSSGVLTNAPDTPPQPDITVAEAALSVADNGSAQVCPVTTIGESQVRTLTVTNSGSDILTLTGITKSGPQAADFVIGTSGLSTLNLGQSTSITVTFTASSMADASVQIQISSNVTGSKSPYEVNFVGKVLSTTADTDGDGMNDAAELKLAALGFNWQVSQTSLVAAYYGNAGAASLYTAAQYSASRTAGQNDVLSAPNTHGLYTPSQVQALHVGAPLIQRNSATGEFTLTLGLRKSTNLTDFNHFPITAPQTTVNAQGQVELKFQVPDNAAFFRLQAQ